MTYLAKIDRATGDVTLYRDGYMFGRLANCESCHVFLSDDEELQDAVEHEHEGDMTLREVLTLVRRLDESLGAMRAAESEAEHYAESAWLRAAEYDPEAQEEMLREAGL